MQRHRWSLTVLLPALLLCACPAPKKAPPERRAAKVAKAPKPASKAPTSRPAPPTSQPAPPAVQLWPALAPARLWLALAEAKIEPELGLIDKGWLLLGEVPTSPRLIKEDGTPHPATKDCPETLEASGKWWYFGGAQPVALQLEDKTATFWVWSVEGRCFVSWEAFPYVDGGAPAVLRVPNDAVDPPGKQARKKVKWKGATVEFVLTIKQATMGLVSGPLEDRVSETVSWPTVGCGDAVEEMGQTCFEKTSLSVETGPDDELLMTASYSYALDYGKGAAPDTRDATRHVRWPVGGEPEEVYSEDRRESKEAAVDYGSDSKSYDQRRVLYLAGGRLTHRREGSKDDGWKESQTETGKGETCRVETKTRKSTWSWTFEPGAHPAKKAIATAKLTLAKATPTSVPISAPTSAPTSVPASAPTALPKASPTTAPTTAPTSAPTKVSPTTAPTSPAAVKANPTSTPTTAPTKSSKAAKQVAEIVLGEGGVDTSKTTRDPKGCKPDSD